MSYPLQEIISLLTNNIRKYGSPFKIDHFKLSSWAYELKIKKGGDTILYTGLLYQLIPYIKATSAWLNRIGKGVGGFLRITSKLLDPSKLIRVNKADIDNVNRMLKNIASSLLKTGLEFGYLYEDEMYSGVLLYDIGMDELFRRHAEKVYEKLMEYGVNNIITIDPHTTYIMAEVYPMFIDGYNIKVTNYLSIISEHGESKGKKSSEQIVIHDPCLYARGLNIIEEPRLILRGIGYTVIEPKESREATYCCGGPIESIYPKLSHEIAKKRINQLKKYTYKILTLCPICYINLLLASEGESELSILDISQLIR